MPSSLAEPDPQLAQALRRLRAEKDLSQEAVARRADLSTGAYAKIERGETSPAWTTVRKIAGAYGLTISKLAAEVDKEP
jgi:transcriptional regulator with XRE-family HTH domain